MRLSGLEPLNLTKEIFYKKKNISDRRITIVCKGEPQNKDFKLTKHGDMLINDENCSYHYPPFLNNNKFIRKQIYFNILAYAIFSSVRFIRIHFHPVGDIPDSFGVHL